MKKKKGKHVEGNLRKNFYFEEYEVDNFTGTSKNFNTKLSLQRTSFIFFIFLVAAFIFGTKIVYLASIGGSNFFVNKSLQKPYLDRQDIVDRNNNLLAKNVTIFSVAIKPKLIKDEKKLLIKLRLNFPSIDIEQVKKNIKKNNFFYLKKRLKPYEWKKFYLMEDKSIILEERQYRVYPQENLFSHVLGQTNDDNFGVSGIEKSLNTKLMNSGDSLILTLDSNLQYIIREELLNANEIFKTKGSAALLMEVSSGEILSLVSLPDYDLNERTSIENPIYLNKITKGVYELGSVFKTFTIAAGLENETVTPSTIFSDLESQLKCGGNSISEHDKLPKDLTVEQILIRSSNIGAIRIAQGVGVDKYRKFLNSLGLFEKMNFELEEIGTPLSFKWGKCKLATASYGHGITTTPLQLARAYAILGNGGYEIQPTLLKKENVTTTTKKQIISSKTSAQVNSILKKVVFNQEGTANFANIEGYDVGGKTGTAYKSMDGVYSNKKINTFVSLFPMFQPKYVLLVMLDEPEPAPTYVYEFPNGYKHKGEMRNTSGWNTVVVAGKIIEKIGPILAINYLQAAKKF